MMRRRQVGWTRWLQHRIQQLRREGFEIDLARRIAKAETAVRQKLGRNIGWTAARQAKLALIVEGDDIRFALTGNCEGLSAERRGRLYDMPGLSPIVSADSLFGFRFF